MARNPAIAATAVGFVLAVVEILGAAGYHPDTALAIVAASDTTKLLLGLAIATAPMLFPAAALLLWTWRQQLMQYADATEPAFVTLAAIGMAFLSLMAAPVISVGTYLLLYLVGDWFPRFRLRRSGKLVRGYMPFGQGRTSFYAWILLFATFGQLELPRPWAPQEVVTLQGGQQRTGVVLGETPTQLSMLVASGASEQVVYIPVAGVTSRVVCRWPGWSGLQSIVILIRPESEPACP